MKRPCERKPGRFSRKRGHRTAISGTVIQGPRLVGLRRKAAVHSPAWGKSRPGVRDGETLFLETGGAAMDIRSLSVMQGRCCGRKQSEGKGSMSAVTFPVRRLEASFRLFERVGRLMVRSRAVFPFCRVLPWSGILPKARLWKLPCPWRRRGRIFSACITETAKKGRLCAASAIFLRKRQPACEAVFPVRRALRLPPPSFVREKQNGEVCRRAGPDMLNVWTACLPHDLEGRGGMWI